MWKYLVPEFTTHLISGIELKPVQKNHWIRNDTYKLVSFLFLAYTSTSSLQLCIMHHELSTQISVSPCSIGHLCHQKTADDHDDCWVNRTWSLFSSSTSRRPETATQALQTGELKSLSWTGITPAVPHLAAEQLAVLRTTWDRHRSVSSNNRGLPAS